MEGRRRVLRPSSSLGAARCYATPKLPLRERKTMTTRIETDSLGDVPVPATAYWGAHTARALENFTISGTPVSRHPHLVRSLAMIKNAAAQANCELGILNPREATAINHAGKGQPGHSGGHESDCLRCRRS